MVEILYAMRANYPRMIELAEKAFGKNYLKPEHFQDTHYTFLVAVEDRHIIGFSGCVVDHGVGRITDVVVEPWSRGKGVATNLIDNCLHHLYNLGTRRIFCQAWRRSDDRSIPLEGALNRTGFERDTFKLLAYYSKDADYECCICGKPCMCDAFIYRRTLRDGSLDTPE